MNADNHSKHNPQKNNNNKIKLIRTGNKNPSKLETKSNEKLKNGILMEENKL